MRTVEKKAGPPKPGQSVAPLAVVGAGVLGTLVSHDLALVVIAAGALWLAWRSPVALLAVYIVLAAFPIGIMIHHHHLEISDVVALAMAAGFLKKVLVNKIPLWDAFLARPFRGPLILLLALSVMSLAVSISPGTTVLKILEYVEFFVVIVAVAHDLGEDEKAWRLILLALFSTVAAVSLFGVYQFLFQIGPAANVVDVHHVRADAWFGQPNAFGGFAGDSFPLLLAMIAAGPAWARRWWMWALLTVDALGVVVSFSRGAWVADAGAVFFMGIAAWMVKGSRSVGWRFVVPGIVIPVMMFLLTEVMGKWDLSHTQGILGFQTTGKRISSSITAVLHPGQHFNTQQRLLIWKTAWRAMVHHPGLGVGLGGFHRYITLHPPRGLVGIPPMAHNLYLEWAADLGVGGVVAALWLQVSWLVAAVKSLRASAEKLPPFWFALGLGAFGTTVSFILHNWVDFMVDHGVIVPLLVAMAALWVLWERVRAGGGTR